MLDKLNNAGNHSRELEKLDQPILIQLGDGTSRVEVWETVTLDFEIVCLTGQLAIRNRRFLIWNVSGNEVILGSDILQILGIDSYKAINALVSSQQKESTTGGVNDSEMKDIRKKINQAVEKAKNAGLPDIWVDRLLNCYIGLVTLLD